MANQSSSDFEKALSTARRQNILSDFWHFLRVNRKWWLVPIVAALLLVSGLMLLGGTAAAPFIYTLF